MSIWGPVQTRKSYSPTNDIEFVTTATHGGFIVYSENECIPAEWKNMTFGQEGWNGYYEEDQDWVYVVLSFPERFDFITLEAAFSSFMTHIKWVRTKGRYA